MKKFLLAFIMIFALTISVFADDQQEVLQFFKNYVNSANTYNPAITTMYSKNAKIIRQVVKPDNTTVDVYTNTDTYIKQMKIGQAGAKLRHYTNNYSNINVSKISNDKFKISSLRQPSGESYNLKTYMIIQKQDDGKWLIIEEMMQTKEQIFLRYAK